MTFKALRDQEQKVIAGLPCPVSAPARLLRLSKGQVRLLLLTDQSFRMGDAIYGDFRVTIKSQNQRFVEILSNEGPLPTKACLEQKQYTQEIQKLSEGFLLIGSRCGYGIHNRRHNVKRCGKRPFENSRTTYRNLTKSSLSHPWSLSQCQITMATLFPKSHPPVTPGSQPQWNADTQTTLITQKVSPKSAKTNGTLVPKECGFD